MKFKASKYLQFHPALTCMVGCIQEKNSVLPSFHFMHFVLVQSMACVLEVIARNDCKINWSQGKPLKAHRYINSKS